MIAKTVSLGRLAALSLLLALPAPALAHPEDASFQSARDAFGRGDRVRLERALKGLETHPLAPWAEYFRLSLQLEDSAGRNGAGDAGVAEFVARHEGSYLAEKMRVAWLKWLMRKEEWARAVIEHARLAKPDGEANCLGLDARLRLGEPDAVSDATRLLAGTTPLVDACQAPLGRLAAASELPIAALWDRLRRQLALGRLKEARLLTGWLPKADGVTWSMIDGVADHPAHHFAKLSERFAESRRGRELAIFAVLRMARSDARIAAARWTEIEGRFDAVDRGFVWGRLALQMARDHQPEASAWFSQAAAFGGALDEDQQAWRVRAALRIEDWPAVARAIDALSPALAIEPEWIYWRARAHAAANAKAAAHALFARIAGQPSFYGILATEALGQTYAPPQRAAPPTPVELAAVAALPGLERGLALIRADMRLDGIREWNWMLGSMSDRQLLAAAELARRHDVIDRSISTANRTKVEHDFSLRYPTPFYADVEPRIREVSLEPAWVYGLMCQESRFIMDAKSGVGAQGLMQLMPATARWVAKKIGMDHFRPHRVTDMDTNVTLGTNYMRMVLDSLDNHPVLASAAYNAGPGRARKWRAERPLEGAIYAETIPFNETRDYVKKVMANAVNYSTLLAGSSQPLTQRLGVIRSRGFGDGTAESLP